ncbi:MAG: hypothetical protein KGJ00_13375, partial [Bradyrhizobium sp.]|nr:hypothetical protein [Bradyrhizobium sp.]
DLADINFNSITTKEIVGDTLTISDGTNTAVINFSGTVGTLNFVADNNQINGVAGTSGTIVYDPPATGQTLTGVTMHDPGQVPGGSIVAASGPNQTLSGSAPSDNFVFNFPGVGQSTITNFHATTDTLQFGSSIFADAQTALNAVHDDGHGNAVLAIDAHDSITLTGVLKSQLHVSDFHIV